MLKWLKKKVYSSLSEVLGAIYNELDSLQPIDTDTVKWTKGLNGMKAHAVVQNSPVAMNQVQEDSEPVMVYVTLKNYPEDSGQMDKFMPVLITGIEDAEQVRLEDQMALIGSPKRFISDYNVIMDKPDGYFYNPRLGEFPPFVVLQQRSNNTTVQAIASGLTYAWVQNQRPDVPDVYRFCKYVSPERLYLYNSTEGGARVVWRPPYVSGAARRLCVVDLLNSVTSGYAGQFCVGYRNGIFCLHESDSPNSTRAGVIDTPSRLLPSITMPITELDLSGGDVYVWAYYNPEDGTFTGSVTQGPEATAPLYGLPTAVSYLIAKMDSPGVFRQVHTTGRIYITGRWV